MAAAVGSEMLSRVPIIVVVGATGTGKTKLSVEIARKFGGEIINADSMQVYSGLDILTNKATAEEQCGVPHHLLGHLKPGDNYHVHRFRKEAFRVIDRLHAQNKIPVIVGGTHYYVESILWKNLVSADSTPQGPVEDEGGTPRKKPHLDETAAKKYVIAGRQFDNLDDDLERLPTEELRDILKEIDPVSCNHRHEMDRRKIKRSIQVFGQTGRRHSDILEEQRKEAGSVHGGSLRYPNAVVFWMQCDKEILQERLTKRVDDMMERGLLAEVEAFHQEVNLKRGAEGSQDFEKSLFQSIGFKDLLPFVRLSPEERASDAGRRTLEQGVLLLRQHTARYAKKQEAWIRNRLLVHGRDVPPVWPLDGSDPSRWDELVARPAAAVVEARLRGQDPDEALILPVPKEGTALPPEERHAAHHCGPCGREFIGLSQYNAHLRGKKHRGVVVKMRKAQQALVDTVDAVKQRAESGSGVSARDAGPGPEPEPKPGPGPGVGSAAVSAS